ncbi:MAG: alcohol dehydrogenase catalytic domain-containing protein [Ruthenibacterium sp.]
MKAVYVKAPYQFELWEIPVPAPQSTQILVEVMACAVCGSDLHTAATDAKSFQSFGHEIAGIARQCGSGGKNKKGDNVVLESGSFCHTCDNCRNGRVDLCTCAHSFMDQPDCGGFAEYITVEEQCAVPFTNLSFSVAALAEPLGVALDLFYTAMGSDILLFP